MSMDKKQLDKAIKLQKDFARMHQDPEGLVAIFDWGIQVKEKSLVDLSYELGMEITTNENYAPGVARRSITIDGVDIFCLSKREVINVNPAE